MSEPVEDILCWSPRYAVLGRLHAVLRNTAYRLAKERCTPVAGRHRRKHLVFVATCRIRPTMAGSPRRRKTILPA